MVKRILIAEDERIIAMDIRRMLEGAGYEVISVAASAIEVIEKAEVLKPDIILMDIMLEGELDGVEAARIILYKHPIPIIFVSALKQETTTKKANLPFFTMYINKPFEDEELLNLIKSIPDREPIEQ